MTQNRSVRSSRLLGYLVPVAAVVLALLIGAVMLAILGANPLEGLEAMFRGVFGSGNALTSMVLKATPLLFVAVGITIAFRARTAGRSAICRNGDPRDL